MQLGGVLLLLLMIVQVKGHAECFSSFNYLDEYVYDINCTSITNKEAKVLENIVVNKERKLVIANSSLSDVSYKLFKNVKNLKELAILNSVFKFGKNLSPFQELSKLNKLIVQDTDIDLDQETFKGLNLLKDLILANTSIRRIESGVLKNLPLLKELNISNNQIQQLQDVPICEVIKLESLILEKNKIVDVKSFNFACTLEDSSIELFINEGGTNIKVNKTYNFDSSYSILRTINFNYNEIEDIGQCFSGLDKLETLELEGNKIKIIEDNALEGLKRLKKLNLKANSIETLSNNLFENKPDLSEINLERNRLKVIDVTSTPSLKYLNLGYNQLVISIVKHIYNLKELNTLILKDNGIVELEPLNFRNFSQIKSLDLSHNAIVLNDQSFVGLSSIQSLILCNSSIDNIPQQVFNEVSTLKNLNLSYNKLRSLDNMTFSKVTELETLDLSYNLLETLQYSLFQNQKKLKILDVAGNQLKSIQYNLIISNLQALSIFSFKANNLSCEFLTKVIDFLKNKRISYNINERFQYEKENVEGIYCHEENVSQHDKYTVQKIENMKGTSISLILFIVVIIVISISFGGFKLFKYHKRRRYVADQFELIEE